MASGNSTSVIGLSSTAVLAVSSAPVLLSSSAVAAAPLTSSIVPAASSIQAAISSISASIAASVSSVVLAPSSSAPAAAASTPQPAPSSADVIVTAIGSSLAPSTIYYTSVVTASAIDGSTLPPIIITVTSVQSAAPAAATTRVTSTTPASSAAASSTASALGTTGSTTAAAASNGLSAAGKTAIAVVIPVVVVAALVLAGLFFWRKKKQQKTAQEARRKEVEEYGYNPNDDPTLPAVGMAAAESPEMTEDANGYRGWGNSGFAAAAATTTSNRKTSTTLSGGALGFSAPEDAHSRAAELYGQNTASEGSGRSAAPLVDGHARSASESEGLDTLGAVGAGIAGSRAYGSGYTSSGVQRGPSNASSSYSAGMQTDQSDDALPGHQQDYSYDHNYSQYTPYYGGTGGYGNETAAQPVIRDVSARRNTRIESPTTWPSQGNAGISQNF